MSSKLQIFTLGEMGEALKAKEEEMCYHYKEIHREEMEKLQKENEKLKKENEKLSKLKDLTENMVYDAEEVAEYSYDYEYEGYEDIKIQAAEGDKFAIECMDNHIFLKIDNVCKNVDLIRKILIDMEKEE